MKTEPGIKNYIRIRNIHILINVSESNYYHLENVVGNKMNQVFHIFVTEFNDNKPLIRLIKRYGTSAKIIIHVPYKLSDLKKTIDMDIKNALYNVYNKNDPEEKYKIIVERKNVSFAVNDLNQMMIDVDFDKKMIKLSIRLYEEEFSSYFYKGINMSHHKSGTGAIRTMPQMKFPELFKDKIIKQFKESTPDGILKSFKNDNDIWDYIMGNGEWKVLGVDSGEKTNDNNMKGDKNNGNH